MKDECKFSTQLRKKVRNRDGNHCFFCNSLENLTVAHIFLEKRNGGKAVEENGMCICRRCHDELDFCKNITKEEQLRMLRYCKSKKEGKVKK
jgi:hypothetical protein